VDLSDIDIDQTEVSFGFVMKFNSLMFKQENLELSVPMFINIGKVKRAPA
jgi:hypothetical protein